MKDKILNLISQFCQFSKIDGAKTPGFSIAYIGKETEILNFGYANLSTESFIHEETCFHVASIAKQITAALILHLDRKSLLSLNDSVYKFLKFEIFRKSDIRLKHLIQHTSGLRDQWILSNLSGWKTGDPISQEDIYWLLSKQVKLNHIPGSEFNYCNTGYTILADIIEMVTNMDINDFAYEVLFSPLGIKNTRFRKNHRDYKFDDASGYVKGTSKPDSYYLYNPPYDIVGSTSLVTNINDMVKWSKFFIKNHDDFDLSSEILNKSKLDSLVAYGHGFYHLNYEGEEVVFHGGWDYGFSSFHLMLPKRNTSIIILSNTGIPQLDLFAFKLSTIDILDNPSYCIDIETKWDAHNNYETFNPKTVENFKGSYLNVNDSTLMELSQKEDKLIWEIAIGYELLPINEHLFSLRNTMSTIVFKDGNELNLKSVFEKRKFVKIGINKQKTAQLQKYVGDYEGDEIPVTFEIRMNKSNILEIRRPKNLSQDLVHIGENNFSFDGMQLTFAVKQTEVKNFYISHPRAKKLFFLKKK